MSEPCLSKTDLPVCWTQEQLGYCSNVHPGETAAAVKQNLWYWLTGVRRQRRLKHQQSGLWLSHSAVTALLQEPRLLADFKSDLGACGVRLVTLNAFPYADFHQAVVKQKVYQPDWSQPQRLAYTLDSAKLLARCLPEDQPSGSISTLPLGFSSDWNVSRNRQALVQLRSLAGELYQLEKNTGKRIQVCLEMEPGCVLESTGQLLRWFQEQLWAGQPEGLVQQMQRYLGVCLDVCHQAVMFESVGDSMRRIHQAGICIGKVQISNALRVTEPDNPAVQTILAEFAEEKYLHQVCTLDERGERQLNMDLAQALPDARFPRVHPWHIHFHVPVQADRLSEQGLHTTRDSIDDVLDTLTTLPELRPHLEVETYTWQLLPSATRPRDDHDLVHGIAQELDWLSASLQSRGLLQL